MDTNLNKILNITLIVIMAITGVITFMFFYAGPTPESAGSLYPEPIYTDVLLNWSYLLFGLAVVLALVFAIIAVIKNPKNAVSTLIVLAAFGLVILVSYLMADDTLLNLPGYTGPDNTPAMLKFADTILYTTYILFVVALLVAFGSVAFRLFRK